MTTLLLTHPSFLGHEPGPYHPERPDRLRAMLAALDDPAFAGLDRAEAPLATTEQLDARSSAGLRPGDPRRPARRPASMSMIDGDTVMSQGSAEAALRAAGAAVAGVDAVMERQGRQGLRRRAPARPSRHARHSRRLLPVQQRRDRRAPCPGAVRRRAGRDPRFRRPSRPRHAGRGRGRPVAVLRLDPPVSALSRHRRRRASAASTATSSTCRCRPGAGSAEFRAAWSEHHPAGARPLRARAGHRLGRLRRPRRRSAGPARSSRPRTSPGSTEELLRHRRPPRRRPPRLGRSKAATTSRRWPTPRRRMCGC